MIKAGAWGERQQDKADPVQMDMLTSYCRKNCNWITGTALPCCQQGKWGRPFNLQCVPDLEVDLLRSLCQEAYPLSLICASTWAWASCFDNPVSIRASWRSANFLARGGSKLLRSTGMYFACSQKFKHFRSKQAAAAFLEGQSSQWVSKNPVDLTGVPCSMWLWIEQKPPAKYAWGLILKQHFPSIGAAKHPKMKAPEYQKDGISLVGNLQVSIESFAYIWVSVQEALYQSILWKFCSSSVLLGIKKLHAILHALCFHPFNPADIHHFIGLTTPTGNVYHTVLHFKYICWLSWYKNWLRISNMMSCLYCPAPSHQCLCKRPDQRAAAWNLYLMYGSSQAGSGIPPNRHNLYVCLRVDSLDLNRPISMRWSREGAGSNHIKCPKCGKFTVMRHLRLANPPLDVPLSQLYDFTRGPSARKGLTRFKWIKSSLYTVYERSLSCFSSSQDFTSLDHRSLTTGWPGRESPWP